MNEASQFFSEALSLVARLAPTVALVLGIVLGGVLLSWMAKRATRWLVRASGLETLVEKAGASKVLYTVGLKDGITHASEKLVWYGGLLTTGSAVADVLGISAISSGIGAVLAFLPKLLSASVLWLVGMWLANMLKTAVSNLTAGEDDAVEEPNVLGQVVYFLVLVIISTVALDQAGIEIDLMTSIVQIALGASAFAMALAFAMGGRRVFSNLIARHYYKSLLHPGDKLRVQDVEGTVVRVSPLAVLVATDTGERLIPCSRLLDEIPEVRRLGGPRDPDEA